MTRKSKRAWISLAVVVALLCGAATAATDAERVERVLAQTPLIDGHNDLPWEIRERFSGDLSKIDLSAATVGLPAPAEAAALMTDIPRLRAGGVGGQFWSVCVPVRAARAGGGADDARADRHRQAAWSRATPTIFEHGATPPTTSCASTRPARIASLIGVEGGHQIDNSLAGAARVCTRSARAT